jgi:ribonuclease HI
MYNLKIDKEDKMKAKIFTDGSARPNPGKGGAGVVIMDENGKVISKLHAYLGPDITNNQAEYLALILALEAAERLGVQEIEVCSDSELLIRQLEGEYRVKDEKLIPLFEKASVLLCGFKSKFTKIPREENKMADRLANEAISMRHTQKGGDE